MKKIYLSILLLFFYSSIFAQSGLKEYRYFGIKAGLTSNFSIPNYNNNNLLIKSQYGDLLKEYKTKLTYSPGAMFEIIYNFDSKNNKRGFVTGISVENIGFGFNYISNDLGLTVNENYRAVSVGVPFVIKYGTSNIYKNQSYITLGLQYNLYFLQQTIQTSSWSSKMYIANIPKEAATLSSLSLIAGFNFSIYFFRIHYFTTNFINNRFTTTIQEGTITPYKHINQSNNVYLTAGVNIPLTRWLTTRSWTAEKIRRFLKGSK